MIRLLNNTQGMALLLVISLVSVLAIITLQFSREMRNSYVVSASLSNSVQLSSMAESGIILANEILLEDGKENTFDSPQDPWALLHEEELSALFPHGKMQVRVFDEGGKFQVNAMLTVKEKDKNTEKAQGQEANQEEPKPKNEKSQEQREVDIRNILWRLLRAEPFLVEDGKAREIIDSLIDWLDSGDGDGEEEYGAEDNYYQSLSPPYSCKNGPIESIDELLLVKGFTKELLYGTEDRPPLAPLLTPLGDSGKININTADILLLQALNEAMTKESAEAMAAFREDENNYDQLQSTGWYKNVPSFPGDIELQQDLIAVASNFFTIEAIAEFGTQRKTVTATVERTADELKTLRWDSN